MTQNVFLDAGFSDEDSTVAALETDAAIAIARFIRARYPNSQTAAAKHLKIGQNEVSAILSGNTARFSLAKLVRIARRAGLRLYFDMGDSAYEAHATTMVVGPVRSDVVRGEIDISVPLVADEVCTEVPRTLSQSKRTVARH